MDLLGNMDLQGLMVLQGTEAHLGCLDPMDRQECVVPRVPREREENLANPARWVPLVPQVFKVHRDPSVSVESEGSLAPWDLRVLPASEVERETRDRLEIRESREYPDLLDLRYPGIPTLSIHN